MESLDILVVDDEECIRSGIVRILKNYTVSYPFLDEDFSFNLIEAATGEEALELINQKPPAIILLDNKLPGIQGVEVLDYINNNQLDILVIMITSYASLELAVKATNIGAYDFVPKPFTSLELKSSIENVAKHFFLRRMTRNLHKEGKRVRFQFLTVLSHELKAPLNAIEGYLTMMQERQAGDNLAAYDMMIDRTLARVSAMRTMILDLLDLTRIESEGKHRQLNELDLVLVAKSAMETMIPLAIQRDVELKCSDSVPVPFLGDAEEFEIIFNNLLSNAIKYNISGGKVMLSIRKQGPDVVIEIADTGVCIAEEDLPRLFMEFSRIKTPKTKEIPGSGLGLNIVQRIVDLYKGTITVDSELGKGSTFRITLPLLLSNNHSIEPS